MIEEGEAGVGEPPGRPLALVAAGTACLLILIALAIYAQAWSRGEDPPYHPWSGLGQICLAMGLLAARRNALVLRGGPLAVFLVGGYALLALVSAGLWAVSAFG